MQICEDALIKLKSQKGKSIKGQLYVSGDGLRVVDDETKVGRSCFPLADFGDHSQRSHSHQSAFVVSCRVLSWTRQSRKSAFALRIVTTIGGSPISVEMARLADGCATVSLRPKTLAID